MDIKNPLAISELVDGWLHLWNGDLDRARALAAPTFRVHAGLMDGGDGSAVSGPDGLAAWIGQTRARVPRLARPPSPPGPGRPPENARCQPPPAERSGHRLGPTPRP
ncbi:unnamed protein product [[Actinomadura] parvosata subsp. kistnae]|uniref:hypothetical protein n=1 Tax=[Actinomadura] parvosata TaxID=1955412 RepID=UPI000D2CDDF3|nr:hypothetical protein [Nonomuraea sp. ATCC 55076]SPL88818.1 unnamed protein product [Actinomadura parvosata subsp. kistnae]